VAGHCKERGKVWVTPDIWSEGNPAKSIF
jgi:hypothetical protein